MAVLSGEGFDINAKTNVGKDGRLKVAITLMHFNYGGAEKMVSLLASHLDLTRYEVRVFCVFGQAEGNALERAVEEHGVRIVHLGKGRGFSLGHVGKMRRALEEYGADVVHSHLSGGVYSTTWALAHGRKMLHTLHSVPDKELEGPKKTIMRFLYHRGHAVPVAISRKNRELTAAFYGLPEDQVEMVVNPVDVGLFSDKAPKPWDERAWDIVQVARFNEVKNHKGLVDAVAALVRRGDGEDDGLRVALVGTGPLEPEVRRQVRELGLEGNVEFLGLRDDVPDILHDSKCFVLPSVYEGLPMSILEAMAAGLPVVATAVGGVPDVVQDGVTGVLVKPGDTEALANAMDELLVDPERMSALARAGFAAAKRYDCAIVAEEYSRLYEKFGKEGR